MRRNGTKAAQFPLGRRIPLYGEGPEREIRWGISQRVPALEQSSHIARLGRAALYAPPDGPLFQPFAYTGLPAQCTGRSVPGETTSRDHASTTEQRDLTLSTLPRRKIPATRWSSIKHPQPLPGINVQRSHPSRERSLKPMDDAIAVPARRSESISGYMRVAGYLAERDSIRRLDRLGVGIRKKMPAIRKTPAIRWRRRPAPNEIDIVPCPSSARSFPISVRNTSVRRDPRLGLLSGTCGKTLHSLLTITALPRGCALHLSRRPKGGPELGWSSGPAFSTASGAPLLK